MSATRAGRGLAFFPVLVAIAVYWMVGGAPILVGSLAALALLSLLLSARVSLARVTEVALAISLFGGALTVLLTVLGRTHAPPDELSTPWASVAGAALIVAVSRFYLAEPIGGAGVTIAIALAGLTACGGASTGPIYPLGVIAFMAAAAVARRDADPARAPRRALTSRRQLGAAAAIAAGTSGIALAFIIALPPLHSWAVDRFMHRSASRIGFSERLALGSMAGMLASDDKVLRIYGQGVDHLRGMTYTRYFQGRWGRVAEDHMWPTDAPLDLDADDAVEIQIISSEPRHYFVPLDAVEIAFSSGVARVDRSAVLAPVAANPASRILYRRSGARSYPLAPADAGDLDVPADVSRALRSLVDTWTAGAATPADKLARIESHLLEGYGYSLEVSLRGLRDPLVEFLLEEKVGHCEYFASAMAILSRMAGVPARVVGGYRVSEYNGVGGYYIVREGDAHAWVEAYLPEQGWTTFDPTPADALARPAASTSFLAGFLDVFGAGYQHFLIWLDRRTIPEILAVSAAAIFVPLCIRWLLQRRRRRGQADRAVFGDQPLPCFERLEAALAARGIVRRVSETLEHLASRLAPERDPADRALPSPLADRAAALVREYAALRYGGVGEEAALSDAIQRFCRELERGRLDSA